MRRFLQRRPETRRVASRFDEQTDNARFGQVQYEIQVLIHRDADFIAGRYRDVDPHAFVAINNAGHAGARVTD